MCVFSCILAVDSSPVCISYYSSLASLHAHKNPQATLLCLLASMSTSVPYLGLSVSVFMKNGVRADEDENPDAHSERPEHLHPLRVTMLFQEPRQSAPCLLGGPSCIKNKWRAPSDTAKRKIFLSCESAYLFHYQPNTHDAG